MDFVTMPLDPGPDIEAGLSRLANASGIAAGMASLDLADFRLLISV